MRVSICVGEYATTPYFVSGLETTVFCMEELCYLFRENASLLDDSIMNRELVQWIGVECKLEELARALVGLVQRKGTLSDFVGMIFEFTGLYDTFVIQEVRQVLKRGMGLSAMERHKQQIDHLIGRRKYALAIRGYHSLIEKWDQLQKTDAAALPGVYVLANTWHNMGVAYTGLMRYQRAAEAFYKAYGLDGNPVHYQAYLAAKRMELSDQEYVTFAAGLPDSYESSLMLERRMEQLGDAWHESPDALRLRNRSQERLLGETSTYFDENDRLLRAMKDGYRDAVSE